MENELREVIIDLIEQLEELDSTGPLVYKWKYEDYPDYVVALGVRKEVPVVPTTDLH